MLLEDAKKIRAAKKLNEESENIVLRPIVAAQLIDGDLAAQTKDDDHVMPSVKDWKEKREPLGNKVKVIKPKTRKPRKTRTKKGK